MLKICLSLSSSQPSVMLKIWTEEFLSVSITDKMLHKYYARVIYIDEESLFADYTEAGSKVYCTTLPRSGWKEL